MPFVFVQQKETRAAFCVVTRTVLIKGFTLLVSLSLTSIAMPKTWYCPHCCRLSPFKRKGNTRKSPRPTVVSESICICKAKPTPTDKLVECHGESCTNGKYFHLSCLRLKRYPNQSQNNLEMPSVQNNHPCPS